MTDRLSVATKITSLSMAGVEKAQPTSERADATRERIVQAARELVVEHGYDGVSTGQVLDRAQVSRGGLYHHFAGKDELMAAVLEAVERDFAGRLTAAIADARDPFDALAHLILALLHEAATMILSAPDRDAERACVGASVAVMIDGLRKR